MILSALDLVCFVIACDMVLNLWLTGSIFAEKRAELEMDIVDPVVSRWPALIAKLFLCYLCLSVYVPAIMFTLCILPGALLDTWVFKLPMYSLAVSSTMNYINGLRKVL